MASLYQRPRSPYWWLKFTDSGVTKRESTGLRVDSEEGTAAAELIRAQWEFKETQGRARASRGYDWGWVDAWLDGHCKSEKTLKAYQLHWRHIQHWMRVAGINAPRDITFRHGHEYVAWRTGRKAKHKTCSKNNALLEVKLLGQVLKQAALSGEIPANPIQSLGIKKEDAKEKREFTDEEIEACLLALNARDARGEFVEEEWLRLSFLIGLHTGLRLRETALVMKHVDFDRMTIAVIPKGGQKKAFTRPLPADLAPVLKPLRDRKVTHEFPFQPSRCFQNFFGRVGVEGVSFHCLRVTYVTRLHREGVPLAAAMRLVNHSSTAVHRIYTKLNVEDVRQYAEKPLFSTRLRTLTSESGSPL